MLGIEGDMRRAICFVLEFGLKQRGAITRVGNENDMSNEFQNYFPAICWKDGFKREGAEHRGSC